MSVSISGSSAPVSFSGIASGLDSAKIIQAEQAPETAVLTQYTNQIGTLTNADTAWQTILSDLQAIGSQTQTLQDPLTFTAMRAQSSNPSALTASAASGTPAGVYLLTVNHLAQGQESISTGSVSDPTALDFGTGTLSIQVGSDTAVPVTIGTGQNSLNGIAAAINAAGAGVTAQVVQTGTGSYQLFLSGNDTSSFTVTDGLSGGSTALGPFGTVQAAQSASVTLGSGPGAATVTSDSNTISTLLPGVTLSLVSQGTSVVTVAADTTSQATDVQNFVSAYNQLVKDINTQNTFNTTTQQPGGPLFGNSLLDLVSGALARTVMSPVAGAPSQVNSLGMIGVSMNSDGTLSVDTTALQSAIQQNPQGVATLIQGVAQATNSAVTGLDQASIGAVPQQVTANEGQIQTLTATVNRLQAQMQQEALILQQEFTAMEQAVSQNEGLLGLLQSEALYLSGSSSSGSSSNTLGTVAGAVNANNSSGSSTG